MRASVSEIRAARASGAFMSVRQSKAPCAFREDVRGNVAIIFALVLMPVLGIVATAVDYGRASNVQRQMQAALDEALVVARDHIDDDRTVIATLMRAHIDANLPEGLKGVPFDLDLPFGRQHVGASIETKVPTTIMAMAGVPALEIAVRNELKRPVVVPLPSAPEIQPGMAGLPAPLAGLTGGRAGGPATADVSEARNKIIEQLGSDPEQLMRQIEKELKALHGAGGEPQMPADLPPDVARMLQQLRR